MREYTAHINDHLTNGLRPEERIRMNKPFLEEAYNVRAEQHGLEPAEHIVDPFNGTVSFGFPYPQIYIGEYTALLMYAQSVQLIQTENDPWVAIPLTIVPVESGGSTTIQSGGQWHIADARSAWYMFNGSSTVARIAGQTFGQAYLDNDIRITTGTHFRGRIVCGGLRPSQIWSRGWDRIFEFWRDNNVLLPDIQADDVTVNYVMWGSIGGGDFPLWLFKPSILAEGNVDSKAHLDYDYPVDESYALERLRLGQFGFMPMPFRGEILCVKTLGNGVMVYGEDGIVYLPHVAQAEPAPTFGMRPLLSVGIADRGAVGGNESVHVFVDSGGSLWRIDAELKMDRLGYKEFFSPMLGDRIAVSLNPERTSFYISNGDRTFLLARGLTEVGQHPSSVFFQQGGLIGSTPVTADTEVRVVTTALDMNTRTIKTATGISLGVSSPHPIEVAFDYRFQKSEAFKRTHFVPVNLEGNAVLRVGGIEFRAVVKCANFENFELDYIKVRWQSSDRRSIRGVDDSGNLVEA